MKKENDPQTLQPALMSNFVFYEQISAFRKIDRLFQELLGNFAPLTLQELMPRLTQMPRLTPMPRLAPLPTPRLTPMAMP